MPIDVDDPATVRAFEQVPVGTFGEAHDVEDGIPVAFHAGSFPAGSPAYRRES